MSETQIASGDRRNDIGMKTLLGLMCSTIGIIISLFVHAAWSTANDGKTVAFEVREDLAGTKGYINSKLDTMQEDLREIKTLLGRKVPGMR